MCVGVTYSTCCFQPSERGPLPTSTHTGAEYSSGVPAAIDTALSATPNLSSKLRDIGDDAVSLVIGGERLPIQ
jgi:hypothetical protein